MSRSTIGKPGSLDGPPVEPSKTLSARAGFAIGAFLGGVLLLLLAVGGLWAVAWLITHFPGVS